jgi:RNA polymerase sigma-70 factor (ECF subfamily)
VQRATPDRTRHPGATLVTGPGARDIGRRPDRAADPPASALDALPDRQFAAVYRTVAPRLLRFLRRAEPRDADDLAGDVWAAMAAQRDRFRGDAAGFEALVFTIARRRVSDHRRRRARRRTDPVATDVMDAHAGGEHTERDVIDRLTSAALTAALVDQLPLPQAHVLLLRVVHGLPVDDVADLLRRSPGSVRVLHHRAIKTLRA